MFMYLKYSNFFPLRRDETIMGFFFLSSTRTEKYIFNDRSSPHCELIDCFFRSIKQDDVV